MSNPNERKPPMGGEKEPDPNVAPRVSSSSDVKRTSSSSPVDSLSFRVSQLLEHSDLEKSAEIDHAGCQTEALPKPKFSHNLSFSTPTFVTIDPYPDEKQQKRSIVELCTEIEILKDTTIDTPTLSTSSISSNKNQEWDSPADVGYNASTQDKNKHTESLTTDLSISERDNISQVTHPLDSQNVSYVTVSNIDDTGVNDPLNISDKESNKILQYGSAQFALANKNIGSPSSETKSDIFPDLSVRPKDKLYTKKSKRSGRRSSKDSKDKKYARKNKSETFPFDDSKNINRIEVPEMSEKTLPFDQSSTFHSDMDVGRLLSYDGSETPIVRNPEYFSHQNLPYFPEESQGHIIRSPFIDKRMSNIIDTTMLTNKEFGKFDADNYPHILHIRFLPLKGTQDMRNMSTQTSVEQSSGILNTSQKLSPKIVDHTDTKMDSNLQDEANVFDEYVSSSQINIEHSQNIIRTSNKLHVQFKRPVHKIPASQHSLLSREMMEKNVETDVKYKDPNYIQKIGLVPDKINYNEEKNEKTVMELLSKLSVSENKETQTKSVSTSPCHVKPCACANTFSFILDNALTNMASEEFEEKESFAKNECYDIIFEDDGSQVILDSDNSPLFFRTVAVDPYKSRNRVAVQEGNNYFMNPEAAFPTESSTARASVSGLHSDDEYLKKLNRNITSVEQETHDLQQQVPIKIENSTQTSFQDLNLDDEYKNLIRQIYRIIRETIQDTTDIAFSVIKKNLMELFPEDDDGDDDDGDGYGKSCASSSKPLIFHKDFKLEKHMKDCLPYGIETQSKHTQTNFTNKTCNCLKKFKRVLRKSCNELQSTNEQLGRMDDSTTAIAQHPDARYNASPPIDVRSADEPAFKVSKNKDSSFQRTNNQKYAVQHPTGWPKASTFVRSIRKSPKGSKSTKTTRFPKFFGYSYYDKDINTRFRENLRRERDKKVKLTAKKLEEQDFGKKLSKRVVKGKVSHYFDDLVTLDKSSSSSSSSD